MAIRDVLTKISGVDEGRGAHGGRILAVRIFSMVLEDELWLILDPSFAPDDRLALYYADEIPLIKDKSYEELREIHKFKLAFPGCRVK